MKTMKPVSKAAQKILDRLFAGMEPGTSKKIDNAKGTFMALSVERLSENTFSMAHYFEQNGDLVADPDMEFWRDAQGQFFCVGLTQVMGFYTRAITKFEGGKPSKFSPRAMKDLNSFATLWCRNIAQQQGV